MKVKKKNNLHLTHADDGFLFNGNVFLEKLVEKLLRFINFTQHLLPTMNCIHSYGV